MKTNKVLLKIAVFSGLALLSILSFPETVGAQDFSNLPMRGPHGAFQVPDSSQDNALPILKSNTIKGQDSSLSIPIMITRGPHGAGFVVTEPGVGGPEGSEVYPGFPGLVQHGPHGAFSPN